jgi:hypothetical protein
MTSEQQKQFGVHLGKIKGLTCPICHNADPNKHQYGSIIIPPALVNGAVMQPFASGALAELFCTSCGFTMLFDCQLAGIKVT